MFKKISKDRYTHENNDTLKRKHAVLFDTLDAHLIDTQDGADTPRFDLRGTPVVY